MIVSSHTLQLLSSVASVTVQLRFRLGLAARLMAYAMPAVPIASVLGSVVSVTCCVLYRIRCGLSIPVLLVVQYPFRLSLSVVLSSSPGRFGTLSRPSHSTLSVRPCQPCLCVRSACVQLATDTRRGLSVWSVYVGCRNSANDTDTARVCYLTSTLPRYRTT